MHRRLLLLFAILLSLSTASAQQTDISTSIGQLYIHVVGQGSLMFQIEGTTIHIDPYSKVGDYATLPKADLILLTHHHGDHLDTSAINLIKQEKTHLIESKICSEKHQFKGSKEIIENGQETVFKKIKIRAVPAYNIVHKRPNGEPYHPKGEGNGYILTFGDKNIYVAGDTENIPEMANLDKIDVAFLPMNLPFTMSPEMTALAAKMIQPKLLFPYHYGKTPISALIELLKEEKAIEIVVR